MSVIVCIVDSSKVNIYGNTIILRTDIYKWWLSWSTIWGRCAIVGINSINNITRAHYYCIAIFLNWCIIPYVSIIINITIIRFMPISSLIIDKIKGIYIYRE